MGRLIFRLWKDESGQDLTEYALLLILVTLFAFASLQALSNEITNAFEAAATNLNVAT